MKRKIIIFFIMCILLITTFITFYINDYYYAENVDSYMISNENVQISKIDEGYFFDGLGDETALIFYPGAKVEETAYSPLLYSLAENGIDCFLVKMPAKLAIFGINKANKITEKYTYSNWCIAGHSLGGAMAASFSYNNPEKIKNIFLLGAYSTENLSEKNINTYFIYGANDEVLSKDKLLESKEKLSNNYDELVIDGGNHALFGSYGKQKGDGEATITNEEQWNLTVNKIIEVMK